MKGGHELLVPSSLGFVGHGLWHFSITINEAAKHRNSSCAEFAGSHPPTSPSTLWAGGDKTPNEGTDGGCPDASAPDRGSRAITTSIGATTLGVLAGHYTVAVRTCLGLPGLPSRPWSRRQRGRSGTVMIWHVFMYKKAYAGHKCNARPVLSRPRLLHPCSRGRPHDGILTLSRSHRTAAPGLLAALTFPPLASASPAPGGLASVHTISAAEPEIVRFSQQIGSHMGPCFTVSSALPRHGNCQAENNVPSAGHPRCHSVKRKGHKGVLLRGFSRIFSLAPAPWAWGWCALTSWVGVSTRSETRPRHQSILKNLPADRNGVGRTLPLGARHYVMYQVIANLSQGSDTVL